VIKRDAELLQPLLESEGFKVEILPAGDSDNSADYQLRLWEKSRIYVDTQAVYRLLGNRAAGIK